jgi:hypothetical protein
MEADNSVKGGECDQPTQEGDFENMYVLVECHAPTPES